MVTRWTDSAVSPPIPWIVPPDPERHVSLRHARSERAFGGWEFVDTSLNGTSVGTPGEWTSVPSEAGPERRGGNGAPLPTRTVLQSGTIIASIHPEYGVRLRMTISEGSA